jgi:hypothetical protein
MLKASSQGLYNEQMTEITTLLKNAWMGGEAG